MSNPTRRFVPAGFSLVELLAVLAIITVVIAMLMPALSRARQQSVQVQCQSNLRQIGIELRIYADNNRGWWYPPDLGTNVPRDQRWPAHVFRPSVWNPPIMLCPSDWEPSEEHSYVANYHLYDKQVKGHTTRHGLGGLSPSEVVLVGEKLSDAPDYYMAASEFDRVVEKYRHGVKLGSNYLYLDLHVSTVAPNEAIAGIDPWDIPIIPTGP